MFSCSRAHESAWVLCIEDQVNMMKCQIFVSRFQHLLHCRTRGARLLEIMGYTVMIIVAISRDQAHSKLMAEGVEFLTKGCES